LRADPRRVPCNRKGIAGGFATIRRDPLGFARGGRGGEAAHRGIGAGRCELVAQAGSDPAL